MRLKKLFSKTNNRGRHKEACPQMTRAVRQAYEFGAKPFEGLSYSVYDQMQQDAMVQTALTLKKLGVLAAEYAVKPSDASPEAKRNADFVESVFAGMEGSPHAILFQAMDAFAKGWSVQEMVYDTDGRHIVLRTVRAKDPQTFGLEVNAYGTITGLNLRLPGEPERKLPREKFVIYGNRPTYGSVVGRSDLDAAYRHWQAKGVLLSAWRQHLERFASPTVLGKFLRGLPVEEQNALLGSLQNLHRTTAIVYPSEIELSTLGGSKESSSGFIEAIEFHNREIARSILGQTLTTDEGRRVGSLALGKVHLQVFLMQLEALRAELADIVMTEQVVRPLVEMNYGPGKVPSFVFAKPKASLFATGDMP